MEGGEKKKKEHYVRKEALKKNHQILKIKC